MGLYRLLVLFLVVLFLIKARLLELYVVTQFVGGYSKFRIWGCFFSFLFCFFWFHQPPLCFIADRVSVAVLGVSVVVFGGGV